MKCNSAWVDWHKTQKVSTDLIWSTGDGAGGEVVGHLSKKKQC